MIGVSLYFDFNLPNVILEICWSVISLYGLARNVFRSARHKRRGPHKEAPECEHGVDKDSDQSCVGVREGVGDGLRVEGCDQGRIDAAGRTDTSV